jgi:hypothetical protein
MRKREMAAWAVAAVGLLSSAVTLSGWLGESAARRADRQQFEDNVRLLQSHAARGLFLEAEKARRDAGGDGESHDQ